jgi:NAD(P)H-flavin reductase
MNFLILAGVVLVMLAVIYRAFVAKKRQREQVCPLLEKKVLNHDTILLKFGGDAGLSIGQHIAIRAQIEGQEVVRKYTPISPIGQRDSFDLLIKIYRPIPRFPKGGLMTQWLDQLRVGDSITVVSPFGNFNYPAPGSVRIAGLEPRNAQARSLLMIAGGSGITPVYQVVQEILRNPRDHTRLCIIFANKTEEDILLRAEL